MTKKIYLGKSTEWGAVYITKHEWHCGWYWSFGYLGNPRCHFHIESLIEPPGAYVDDWTNVDHHFERTWLTQSQWWVLRDLFLAAYALKTAAEVYKYGGHQTELAAPFRVINAERAKQINADLETLLDNIWEFLSKSSPNVKAA